MENTALEEKFEIINCNICGCKEKEIISFEDVSRLVRCKKCKLIYVDNRLTLKESIRLYNQNYFTKERRELSHIREKHILNKIKRLKNTNITGNLLDIGCAEGEFLRLIENSTSFKAFGVDISEYAAKEAQKKGLNVKNCDVLEAAFPDNYFDVVTLRHVLEHLHDPLKILKEVNRVLKKDGILIIEVPNLKYMLFKTNFLAKVFNKQPHLFETKEHLYHFDSATIIRLLKLSGFTKPEFFPGFPDESSKSKFLTRIRIAYSYISSLLSIFNNRLQIGSVINLYAVKGANICFNIGRIHNLRAGVNRYALCLTNSIESKQSNNVFYFKFDMPTSTIKTIWLQIWIKIGRLIKVLFQEQLYLAWLLKKNKIDLTHNLAYVGPILSNKPMIITIYDMAYLIYPDKFTMWYRIYLKLWVPISTKKAKKIIAISKNTKNDIIKYLKIPEDKIDVVYCGVDSSFNNTENINLAESILKKHNLSNKKYILYVGTMEPRKNLVTLLKAFRLFLDEYKLNYDLVIVGQKGWLYDDIFKTLETLRLNKNVFFTGVVTDEELPFIYKGASLFVYPSIYEGFGLPVLEAMTCGVPVITSNTSSLPEVIGDAGITIDPMDIKSLSKSMHKVLTDKNTRDLMISKGLERAKLFTWENAAKKTIEIYKDILSN